MHRTVSGNVSVSTTFIAVATVLTALTASPFLSRAAHAYAEDTKDPATGVLHSSFHFDLVRTLAAGAGFSADDADLVAKACQATDLQNFRDVHLAGTERPSIFMGAQAIGLYYHWPRRNPHGEDGGTCQFFRGSDIPSSDQAINCPFTLQSDGQPGPCQVDDHGMEIAEVDELAAWALDGAGLPRFGAPTIAISEDANAPKDPVAPASLPALGIFLHSLADSFSHQACAEQCAFQGHSDSPINCTAMYWHQVAEYGEQANGEPNIGVSYTLQAAGAVWTALGTYRDRYLEGTAARWTDAEAQAFIDHWVLIPTGPRRAAAATAAFDKLTGTR